MGKANGTAGTGSGSPKAATQREGASPSSAQIFPAEMLHELVEAGSDWLWETDAELRFSWLSDGYEAATGIDPSTVLGRFRFDFLKQILKGGRNLRYDIQTGSDLATWSLLSSITVTNINGTAQITQTNAPGSSPHFYRAVLH